MSSASGPAAEQHSMSMSSSPSSDFEAEGTVLLEVPNVSKLSSEVRSSFHTIANLPWRMDASTECSKRTANIKCLSVYIDCNPESESTLWSCEVDVEFRLSSQTDNIEPYSRSLTHKFDFNCTNRGYPSFLKMSEVLDEKRGFIKDDEVLVEAHIKVKKTQGVRLELSPAFDFAQPGTVANPSDDCVLVIEDTRLHVSKTYLSVYSPVFSTMFFGEFREKDLREVPIKDVAVEEFIEMLHVIYPSRKPITADNVEYLLKLADRFDVQRVIVECEAFLMRCGKKVSVATKLLCADRYSLANLQDMCVRTFKAIPHVKRLRSTDEYEKLSDATKIALLEKMFKLAD